MSGVLYFDFLQNNAPALHTIHACIALAGGAAPEMQRGIFLY